MSEIEWTPIKVKLGELAHWADNPVTISKAAAKKLIKSKEKLGKMQTLGIGPRDESGRYPLYDGHQRANVWGAAYGMDLEVWALMSDRPLDDEERHAVPIMLRAAVGALNWDTSWLTQWPDAVRDWGMDKDTLATWNNDAANLATMLEATEDETTDADAEPQIDRAAELNEKWQVKRGDLWRIGEHRLLCGDSTVRADVEKVMGGDRCAMCFTSPPYNAGVSAKLRGNTSIDDNLYKDEYNDDKTSSEYLSLLQKFTAQALSCCEYVFVNIQPLAGNKRALVDYWHDFSDKFCDVAIWDKQHAAPEQAQRVMDSRFEFVLIFGGNGSRAVGTREFRGMVNNVYSGSPQRNNEYASVHAATFPIELPTHFIGTFTNVGESIAEFFCGTGTTLVACQNLQRKCRAIEISPNYCAVILDRMATAFPGIEIERIEN